MCLLHTVLVVHRPKAVNSFTEDKTKSILFSIVKCLKEINISLGDCFIKQHDTVEYLGCQLDYKLSREAIS